MNDRLFFPMFNLMRLPANYPILVGKKTRARPSNELDI